ncbi:MAG: pyridoxal-dependent decarboxylase [Thermoguttaceae bacterium]|nr:pyridoxal-dependent decarboxylase [Thermoguttaceae bacterium]
MRSEEFRKCGYEAVDWIANYMEQLEADAVRPVLSQVQPGEIYAAIPSSPPEQSESFDAMMRDLDTLIMPGITHWRSPSFFGYFPSNVSGPAILGELLAAGIGAQGMLWATSPACTEVEMRMMDWLVEACGLPSHFLSRGPGGGVIQGSASEAAVCALVAAREAAQVASDHLCGYISKQTHSSIEKAWKVLGLPVENLRKIETCGDGSFDCEALESAIQTDQANGLRPCFAVGTIGTTSQTAIDPIRALGEICRKCQLWLHVDGAYGGSAMVCPELRWMIDGLELANSYCFNPHKWLLVNFDCDCFFVSDRRPLNAAMSILPEYLRNAATESGKVIDYRDWQIPLGRRFRALKLWMTIRYYGTEGLRKFIRHKIELGQTLASLVDESLQFVRVAGRTRVPDLALVCFYHRDGDAKTKEILERCNASGEMMLSHTVLKMASGEKRYVIRMHTASALTEAEHITAAWRKICRCAE